MLPRFFLFVARDDIKEYFYLSRRTTVNFIHFWGSSDPTRVSRSIKISNCFPPGAPGNKLIDHSNRMDRMIDLFPGIHHDVCLFLALVSVLHSSKQLIISVLLLVFNRSESKLSGSIAWVSSLPRSNHWPKMSLRKDSSPASAGSVRWNLSEWSL